MEEDHPNSVLREETIDHEAWDEEMNTLLFDINQICYDLTLSCLQEKKAKESLERSYF
jgi:hypothetical protein